MNNELDLLTYFAANEAPFMMECCERTESDKKGGHLAQRCSDGQLILRESAQCSKSDEANFQDISRHRFFNTNNLWVRLDKLKEIMEWTLGCHLNRLLDTRKAKSSILYCVF